jgi:hypothetical protein
MATWKNSFYNPHLSKSSYGWCMLATSWNWTKDPHKNTHTHTHTLFHTPLDTLIMQTPTLVTMYVGLDNPLACCLDQIVILNINKSF